MPSDVVYYNKGRGPIIGFIISFYDNSACSEAKLPLGYTAQILLEFYICKTEKEKHTRKL